MTTTRRTHAAIILAAAAAAGAAPARAQDPRTPAAPQAEAAPLRATLVDETLAWREVELLSLDERAVSFIDEQQRRRTLPRAAVLALIPRHQAPSHAHAPHRTPAHRVPEGALELTDGQRFPGDLRGPGDTAEQIAWSHPGFGNFTVPLERVSAFWRTGVPMSQRAGDRLRPASSDTILLMNGDVLRGYLAAVDSTVRVESADGDLELPFERIAGARLSNAPESPRGAWVWLAGGTAARVERFGVESVERVLVTTQGGRSAQVEWSALRALVFDAARLRPLSSIEPDNQAPGPGRRYAPPLERLDEAPPMDAHSLLLPGPMTVSWTLPRGVERFAAEFSLEPGSQPWGDCEVVIAADGAELHRRRLTPAQPRARVALPVAGSSLSITVVEGRHGPVRNRVLINAPLLLVRQGQ